MPRRAALLAVLAAVISLTAATAPVGAEVRIGSNLISQPDTAGVCGPTECTAGNIALPPAKRALQGVLSPVNGTIASWLYRAGASSPNPISLQVLHPNGGLSFTATGTSSAVPVVGGVQGQFGTALPIGIGDAIGLRTQGAQVLTSGIAGATQISWTSPALAQGSTRDGAVTADVETLVQAIIAPTSSVGFGAIERRKKKGTAGIRVSVPNAGTLSYSGLGVSVTGPASIGGPGEIQIWVKAKGKKRKRLRKKGNAQVSPQVTFTPTMGDPGTTTGKLKLIKKPRR